MHGAAYAVVRCPFVCLSVRWCILSKRVNVSSNFLSPSGSHTIQVFQHQTLWQYSNGDHVKRASNAGGVGKNRDPRQIFGYRIDDCCSAINKRRSTVQFTTQTAKHHSHQWIWFITASMDVHDEQNLFVRSGKSEAEVTNNRILRSTYCTIEANRRHTRFTRSIARPLCYNRAQLYNSSRRRLSWLTFVGAEVQTCRRSVGSSKLSA